MNYSIELFFNCFSDIKRLTIFVYGEYHVLSLNRFKALPNCTFMLLGFEWVKQGNTITKKGV